MNWTFATVVTQGIAVVVIAICVYADYIRHVTVQGNLLQGDGYRLVLEAHSNGYSDMHCVNNRIDNSTSSYGPTYVSGGTGWDTWSENYAYDSGATDAKGATIGEP